MIQPRCDTRYEGCTCRRPVGHPGPHRCDHAFEWTVRPNGRIFTINDWSTIRHPVAIEGDQ